MTRGKATIANKGKAAKDGVHKAKRSARGSKRDWSQYSHNLPDQTELAKNGRQTGRNLIAWTRPRMAEKLLLHIEYEALLHNRPIPWDAVAHRFNPGSSGDAITQRLMRMRKELIAEGHLVPPHPQKPGGPVEDVAVRGLIRANPDRVDDAYTTRRVLWTEPIDDPKKPLGNAVYALQGSNETDGARYDEDSDEGEDANDLNQRSFSGVRASGFGAVQSTERRGAARPVRPVRPTRSTAKHMSYAENQDDVFNEGFATNIDEADGGEDGEDGGEDDEDDEDGEDGESEDEKLGIRNGLQASSRNSRGHRSHRSRGLNAGARMSDSNYLYDSMTPGARGQVSNHMSPYGIGMHWVHSPYGLPIVPMGLGMDMTTLSGINTMPGRSSAFTTHATSPAAFDIEDASPRSAAFFQAHLDEYNSPTPRGHAHSNPMVPMFPFEASMGPGNIAMPHDDPNLAVPKDPFEADLSSMFGDADTVAKRLKKTNKRE